MPTVNLSPGPWPTLRAGTTYLLAPGEYPPLTIPGLADLAFRCVDGWATIRGGVDLGADEPPCAIRAHDGADRLLLEGIDAACDEGRGIRVTVAKSPTLRRCRSLGNLLEAATLATCPGLVVADGEFGDAVKEDGRWPLTGRWLLDYPPDKRHALYLSHNVDGAQVLDTILRDAPGSFQVNGKEGPTQNVTGQRLQLLRLGSSGTLALSLMGCVDSTFSDLFFDGGNKQGDADGGLGRLFSDGKSGPCERVTIRNFSSANPTNTQRNPFDLEDAQDCTIDAGAGWQPGQVPTPEPPPAMTDEEQTAAIRDLDRRVAALEQARAA